MSERPHGSFLLRLQQRGVIRVAIGYAVIGWLLLQIGDVVLEPLDAPQWVMRALILILLAGFPVALLLAWFLELGPTGITVDRLPEGAERPTVPGIRRYADLVIIVVLLGVIALLVARQEGLLEPAPETPVLAVLPFHEIGKEEIGYFGAGLADTLTGKLGQLSQLVVLASSSTQDIRDSDLDLAETGARLGATALLLGSVQRAGGLLRVNTRLVDPRTGQQLWTQSYDRDAGDLFAVQDDIALSVAQALARVLTPEQSQRLVLQPTSSLSAYEAYLRALDDLGSRDYDRMPSALRYLRDAVALDPGYALAHATLTQALFLAAAYRRWDTPWQEVRSEAQQAAERAVELDPQLGEAWFASAMVRIGDIENETVADRPRAELIALLQKALALSPSNSAILKQLAHLQDTPEAEIRVLQRAARIDPRSGIIRVNIGERYHELGDYASAEDWFIQAARATDPYFALGYKALTKLHRVRPGGQDQSARWSRAFFAFDPDNPHAAIEYCRSLLELGAWSELEAVLRDVQLREQRGDGLHWTRLLMQTRLARARGDFADAARHAEEFVREQMITYASWPDLTGIEGPSLVVFEAMALADLQSQRPEAALTRYREGYGEAGRAPIGGINSDTLRAPVMIALLHRSSGDEAQAAAVLRATLLRLDEEGEAEQSDHAATDFTRFTLHALLGDTEAAIVALRASVDSGWVAQWWGLKDAAAYDANYAAVVTDPRFVQLHARVIGQVEKMRESFRSHPDLPEDTLLQAGLLPLAR